MSLPIWVTTDTVPIILAVLGVLGGGFWWMLGEPKRAALLRWVKSLRIRPASGTHFTILLADLFGDDDQQTQTTMLAETLADTAGIKVCMLGRTLQIPRVGLLEDQEATLLDAGTRLLQRANADLLVAGQDTGKILKLRFISRNGRLLGVRGFARFTSELKLQKALWADVCDQFLATALSEIEPSSPRTGYHLAEILQDPISKLQHLVDDEKGVDPGARWQIFLTLGRAESKIGEQTGDTGALDRSIRWFMKAFGERPDAHDIEHVMGLNDLAFSLLLRSEGEMESDGLREAESHLREALSCIDCTTYPYLWAEVETNLGNTLKCLGEREASNGILSEAVETLSSALKKRERETVPLEWAITKNDLGAALRSLGDRTSDQATLDEAIAAYRDALSVFTQSGEPYCWATCTNNLANALSQKGAASSEPAALNEALRAYKKLLRFHKRHPSPLQRAMTKCNMGLAMMELGKIEGRLRWFRRSARTLSHALQQYQEETAPRHWATIQDNLGNTYLEEWNLTKDTASLVKARRAFVSALRQRSREDVPVQWARSRVALARTVRLLREAGAVDIGEREEVGDVAEANLILRAASGAGSTESRAGEAAS